MSLGMKLLQNFLGFMNGFLSKLLNGLTSPHTAIFEVGMRRQAQFSAVIALLLLLLLSLQISVSLATGRFELGLTLTILWVGVLLGYGLSRGKSPQWGSVLLIYGFTLFAFILTGLGVSDIATTMYGMIPIAYVLAGVLLSVGWQILLVALVLAGSVFLGAMQLAAGVNMNMLGGNLVALGVVLILTSKLRDGIERRRLAQLRQINRELEATRDHLSNERTLLQNSEARTRALLAAIPDMVFELSRDGAFLDFVPSLMLKPIMLPEHFLGRNVSEVMPPEVATATLNGVQQVLADGQVQTFEYQLPAGDTPHHFEARMVASRPEAVLAIVRDITERKQAEGALLESESRFRGLVEKTSDGIMFFDSLGRVIEWNNAMQQMTGLSREKALRMHGWDIQMQFTPDEEKKDLDFERLKLLFRQSLETGSLPTLAKDVQEARILHVNGSHRIAEQRLFLIKTVQGYSLGAVFHDITERKQAEAERESLIKDLEVRNAELELYAYTASHDIKIDERKKHLMNEANDLLEAIRAFGSGRSESCGYVAGM